MVCILSVLRGGVKWSVGLGPASVTVVGQIIGSTLTPTADMSFAALADESHCWPVLLVLAGFRAFRVLFLGGDSEDAGVLEPLGLDHETFPDQGSDRCCGFRGVAVDLQGLEGGLLCCGQVVHGLLISGPGTACQPQSFELR